MTNNSGLKLKISLRGAFYYSGCNNEVHVKTEDILSTFLGGRLCRTLQKEMCFRNFVLLTFK